MTIRGVLISLFGPFHLLLVMVSGLWAIWLENWIGFAAPIFFLYIFPVICFRVHDLFCPLREGMARLDAKGYSPWWGGHNIQSLFNTIPWLESILRMFPGVYSAWLRMWGSCIGKGVIWTAQVEVIDRSMLDVGDRVVFGHKAGFYPHVINPTSRGLMLYVKRITIGNGAFIGAGSRLGPGVFIEDNAVLPVLSDISVNQRVRKAA